MSDDVGQNAVKYLRSMERAASDRLSRVRREEALASIPAPTMAMGNAVALSESDSAWRSLTDESDSDDDELPGEDEREHAREVLLKDG
jgi:hypothetical protein